jgi:hypothetical protein
MFAALNAMMLDMLAAVARKDYEDRRRRQVQGIVKAKAAGSYRGRPEDTDRNAGIAGMLRSGMSWTAIQAATSCSRATIAKVAKRSLRRGVSCILSSVGCFKGCGCLFQRNRPLWDMPIGLETVRWSVKTGSRRGTAENAVFDSKRSFRAPLTYLPRSGWQRLKVYLMGVVRGSGTWDEDRNNGWLTCEHRYYRQILGYLLHKSIYIGERASVCRSLTHAVQITIERFTRA